MICSALLPSRTLSPRRDAPTGLRAHRLEDGGGEGVCGETRGKKYRARI